MHSCMFRFLQIFQSRNLSMTGLSSRRFLSTLSFLKFPAILRKSHVSESRLDFRSQYLDFNISARTPALPHRVSAFIAAWRLQCLRSSLCTRHYAGPSSVLFSCRALKPEIYSQKSLPDARSVFRILNRIKLFLIQRALLKTGGNCTNTAKQKKIILYLTKRIFTSMSVIYIPSNKSADIESAFPYDMR